MTRQCAPIASSALSPGELAERLGVPVMTVYAWNSRGGGPRFMRFGKHVRYKVADVEAWEDAHYAEQAAR
ncbi:helix-turn-helix transcriptional regulator [Nonomuraea basaltis]|uniref:helix-turn-helix transcriptional regulator n=1 Tax=Nonomuraea basaltis TaxID=2495887 RepID=UPI00110C6A6E|nr:helix-turn-helix domain-containing protein [Nonomuraea basaltis]TMR92116.1 helix-turn-helix domain-containing protein [Nonomuraea basaltis]